MERFEFDEESLYRMKMSLVPAYIIAGIAIILSTIMVIVTGSMILPKWFVFVNICIMFLMVFSILWPGMKFADYMVKRKKRKNEKSRSI